jgi:transposase InsO family protein
MLGAKGGPEMPWQECSVESERMAFVIAAQQEAAPVAALCRQFGISRKTGYKWLARAGCGAGVADRSRRPHTSPRQTPAAVEQQVMALRQLHPVWGGRKLHHRLVAEGLADVPAPSTITGILRRQGDLMPIPPPRDFGHFEHPVPNAVWQMDFMGHRALGSGAGRVHPWSLLDDHSRFALALAACAHQQGNGVQDLLTAVFRQVGLPHAILCDNGSPWGTAGMGGLSRLEAWLLRLGIEPWHGRPYHPQTQGKVERFHGTIAREVFAQQHPLTLGEAQACFDAFRHSYNHERPHEALGHATPASRYQPSARPFPETLPPVTYEPGTIVQTVTVHGSISWKGRRHFISRGLVGELVALQPTEDLARWTVVFGQHQVATIDLRQPDEV